MFHYSHFLNVVQLSYVQTVIPSVVSQKNYYHAHPHSFIGACSCRCYPMAGEHLYPNGSKDQEYSECCSCNSRYIVAVKNIWIIEFTQQDAYIIVADFNKKYAIVLLVRSLALYKYGNLFYYFLLCSYLFRISFLIY